MLRIFFCVLMLQVMIAIVRAGEPVVVKDDHDQKAQMSFATAAQRIQLLRDVTKMPLNMCELVAQYDGLRAREVTIPMTSDMVLTSMITVGNCVVYSYKRKDDAGIGIWNIVKDHVLTSEELGSRLTHNPLLPLSAYKFVVQCIDQAMEVWDVRTCQKAYTFEADDPIAGFSFPAGLVWLEREGMSLLSEGMATMGLTTPARCAIVLSESVIAIGLKGHQRILLFDAQAKLKRARRLTEKLFAEPRTVNHLLRMSAGRVVVATHYDHNGKRERCVGVWTRQPEDKYAQVCTPTHKITGLVKLNDALFALRTTHGIEIWDVDHKRRIQRIVLEKPIDFCVAWPQGCGLATYSTGRPQHVTAWEYVLPRQKRIP